VAERHLADVLGASRWRSVAGTAELIGQIARVG
jgi:hypothetical protein